MLIYPYQHSALTEHTIKGCSNVNSEILAIAINPAYQRRGIGQMLIKTFEQRLWQCNIKGYYKAATNFAEMNSNAFYKKVGFAPCHQVKHNDLILQVYLKDVIAQAAKNLIIKDANYVR